VRARLAIAISCGALLLAGCGGDGDQNERQAAQDVVEKFALADGPEACEYLGGQALEDNYGGNDYATGKDRCEKAAKDFEGEPITVNRVQVTSDTTARVDAESEDGRIYVVSLSKPEDDWVIERIIQQRRE
jgi:Tfp pilus assembly major pilin PilA